MHRLVSVSFLAMTTAVIAACQQMPAGHCGQAGQAGKQSDRQEAMATGPAPGLPARADPPIQPSGAPVVEFRLAQSDAAAGLQSLKLGERQLWVLQQPVLTRGDLLSVAPAKSRAGASYVRFQFTPAATPRLAAITQRYPGRFLLLSIDGELAAAPTIGGPMTAGVLFVPVIDDQQAARLSAAVAGNPPPQAR